MKKRRLFGVGAAALALAVGITSCQGLLYNNRPGQEIRFSASMQNGAMTRTAYSDEEFVVEGKRKERIDWEDGDQVKIYLFLDNAPDYFFEPDEKNHKLTDQPISADYSVAYDSETGKDAYKSRGKLSAIDKVLRWVGIEDNVDVVDHWFYSVYPAKLFNENSVTPDQDNYSTATITFPNLSGQDGSMDYAYMAAVAGRPYKTGEVKENREKEAGTVDLDYYPMVTTVYVTFVNNSTQTEISKIKLTGSQPLVGGYSVKYSGGDGGVLVENSISNSNSEDPNSITLTNKAISDAIPFFLIPQEYDAKELSLTINGTTHPLRDADEAPLTLLPFHKYNVIVTINEDGKVEPPVIGNPEAQMIFALLLQHDHFTLWELLGDYFTEYFGYTSADPDLLNGLWNDKIKGVENLGLEQMYDELIKWFPDDKLNGLLDAIGLLTEIELAGNGPDLTADILNFSIFKNAKKIHFDIRQQSQKEKDGECREIIFDGLSSLECIDIKGESSGTYNLSISNCPKLQKCDLRNDAGLKLKNLSITNCSTKTDGAYIHISSQDGGTFTLTRSGDTKNVIVECGYYDMISYWPLVYGDWHATWTDSI